MENQGDAWHAATAKRIGAAIARRRKHLGMTAQQLAERCANLGVPIHRTTITKIEKGRPRFDLGELIVIAAALGVPPVALIYPDLPDGKVEVLPGQGASSVVALMRFSGEVEGPDQWKLAKLSRELFHMRIRQEIEMEYLDALVTRIPEKADEKQLADAAARIVDASGKAEEIRDLESRIREISGSVVDGDA